MSTLTDEDGDGGRCTLIIFFLQKFPAIFYLILLQIGIFSTILNMQKIAKLFDLFYKFSCKSGFVGNIVYFL